MVGVTFVKRNRAESDEPLQPHERNHDLQDMNGLPLIDSRQRDAVRSTRPGPATRRAAAASSRARPASRPRRGSRLRAARSCRRSPPRLSAAGHERGRRSDPRALYAAGAQKGTFEAGIEQGLRLILASPKFLFRTETAPVGAAARA